MLGYIINHYSTLTGWHCGDRVYTCKAFAENIYNGCQATAEQIVEGMHSKGYYEYNEYYVLVELPIDTFET